MGIIDKFVYSIDGLFIWLLPRVSSTIRVWRKTLTWIEHKYIKGRGDYSTFTTKRFWLKKSSSCLHITYTEHKKISPVHQQTYIYPNIHSTTIGGESFRKPVRDSCTIQPRNSLQQGWLVILWLMNGTRVHGCKSCWLTVMMNKGKPLQMEVDDYSGW